MKKRGRPPKYTAEGYKELGQLLEMDSKRNIQNTLYKTQATKALSDYVLDGNKIPHFDYILDIEGQRAGKFTYTWKQTVFTELGRLYDYLKSMEDEEFAINFLVEYTGNLCTFAKENRLSVRDMEKSVRDKRLEVKELYDR